MANRKVALVRKCKTPDGWRRYPVVMAANGKVKPDAVIVDGKEATFSTGHYELRSYVGSKVAYERVPGNATEALAALKLAQKRANAVAMAGNAGVQIVEETGRRTLRGEYKKFIQAAKDRGSNEAAEVYALALDEFLSGCPKVYVDELDKMDVTRFHVALKARGMAARTVHNRHMSVRAFIIALGLDPKALAGKAPRFDKTLPEIFEPGELAKFFGSLSTDYDRLLFTLLLKTGLREREAMHLEWADISFAHRTLKVRSKSQHGHKIKDAEERELTLTDDLIMALQAYRETSGHRLIFGKRGGAVDAPDGHLLRRCKVLARKAGLNCDRCDTCQKRNECEKWFLHKFRATYCTTLLRSGLDLRTVQSLAGHADLASTMRYLRPAGTTEIQGKVNAVRWF
jgi:integrase